MSAAKGEKRVDEMDRDNGFYLEMHERAN